MIDKALGRLFALLAHFVQLYFSNFRIGEFTVAMGLAYATGQEFAQRIGVSPTLAPKIGAAVTAISAITYIRNPKKSEWVQPARRRRAQTQQAPEPLEPQADCADCKEGVS